MCLHRAIGFNDCLRAALTCAPHTHTAVGAVTATSLCVHATTNLKGRRDWCASCWDVFHGEKGEG